MVAVEAGLRRQRPPSPLLRGPSRALARRAGRRPRGPGSPSRQVSWPHQREAVRARQALWPPHSPGTQHPPAHRDGRTPCTADGPQRPRPPPLAPPPKPPWGHPTQGRVCRPRQAGRTVSASTRRTRSHRRPAQSTGRPAGGAVCTPRTTDRWPSLPRLAPPSDRRAHFCRSVLTVHGTCQPVSIPTSHPVRKGAESVLDAGHETPGTCPIPTRSGLAPPSPCRPAMKYRQPSGLGT